MATVSPLINISITGSPRFVWSGAATGDTLVALPTPNGSSTHAAVQVTGTFGGATVKLQASTDGTNFYDIKDMHGTAISATAAGGFEFVSSAAYLRPAISGGTGDAVDVTVILRD
jgi:hypothetical protein